MGLSWAFVLTTAGCLPPTLPKTVQGELNASRYIQPIGQFSRERVEYLACNDATNAGGGRNGVRADRLRTWFRLPVMIQSSILWLGWPVLYVVTIAQTVVMIGKMLRRQHGYKV